MLIVINVIVMDKKILNFTIFCVGNLAEYLKMNARDVYHKMQEADIISSYIIPCYEVLHSVPKEYIIEDLSTYMKKKGVL